MKAPKNPRPRFDRIKDALQKLGPSTVLAIANETGIPEQDVGQIIRDSRKKDWPGIRIRKAGKTNSERGERSWIYELSDEPDAVVEPVRNQPSRVKRIKNPGMTREEIAEMKRTKEALKQIKPFRDPLIWSLFGGATV